MKNLYLFILMLLGVTQGVTAQTLSGTFNQVPCNNDGVYTVTATGLSLPITYTYYLDGATIVHTNVNSATDQLTGIGMTAGNSIYCQANSGSMYAYTQTSYTPAFQFEIEVTHPVCPVILGTITANQISGSSGPFSFVWTNSETSVAYTGATVSVPAGDYLVDITDQGTGCVLHVNDSAAAVYQISDIEISFNSTMASCTNGTSTATVTGGAGPYTYLWDNGSTSATVNGLSQGYYELEVTDAQGCQATNAVYIEQNPFISVNTTVSDATCLQSDGSAMAFGSGGQPPYSYAWSNGQTGNNATNLTGGTYYTVVATDANGCVGTGYANILSSTPITVNYSSTESQCTSPTGSATIVATGGTLPYSYSWLSNSSTSATVSSLAPGTYPFIVTDASGCIRTGAVVVNPVSQVFGNISASAVVCPATTGSLTVSAWGEDGPFTYQWSNGATTASINGVSTGGYSCVITNALNCSITRHANLVAYSPVGVGLSVTPATCMYNTDGSAVSTAFGGTAPYSYVYTSGSTTATASNLGVGEYWVTATDATGCANSQHFWITDANTTDDCYCTISGNVYLDGNADCTHDSGENGIEHIMIHCSGRGYTFTDAAGNYSFKVPSGTYTISQQVNQYYPLSACQTNSQTVSVVAASGCNTTVDFSNTMNVLHDLKIVTMNATAPPIPGNNYSQKLVVMNWGTVAENDVQMGYEHDGQLTLLNASASNFAQQNSANPEWYSVTSGFPVLNPGYESQILLNYGVPTSIPMNTMIDFKDSVAHLAPIDVNWLLDYTPWNNVNHYQPIVVSSYDPNYKEVSPQGQGPEGYVPMETKEFDYTIHFQNEGTYFAQNIVVTDQLDADLDWTSFRPGYSEYPFTTTISETGLVTFTFPNINLPWKSSYGDELSSSVVHYSIKRKDSNPVGTVFTNTANIYFDYNAPITTNTTMNTLSNNVGIEEIAQATSEAIIVDLYPVPASDQLTIRVANNAQSGNATVSVIDLMGKTVLLNKVALNEGATVFTQHLPELVNGTYLTRIEFENGSAITKKIVVVSK